MSVRNSKHNSLTPGWPECPYEACISYACASFDASPKLLLNCIRGLLRIAVDIENCVDLEIGPLLRGGVRRLFGVAVHVEDGIDIKVCPLHVG